MENTKSRNREASRSKESLAQKEWEVAYNYVNIAAGNKTEAYLKYYRDHGIKEPLYPAPQATKFFNRERVKNLVEEFRAENRANYGFIRDENIAMLRDIASKVSNKKTDRIAAMKELNSMLGINQTNINVETNTITLEFIDE